jgi:beta-lysine 5,6-aminomutase alpha subunit
VIQLSIDARKCDEARSHAKNIVDSLKWLISDYTSATIERTVLRFLGIDGAVGETPIPNIIVDHLISKQAINRGAAYWVANAMARLDISAQEVGERLASDKIDLTSLQSAGDEKIRAILDKLTDKKLAKIRKQREFREHTLRKYGGRNRPALYLIVASGNIYDDVVQARAAVSEGADIIAVIRSTAQSLLDYVPYGATTVGFGGTFATQENFRIMREALDEAGAKVGKYIFLTNYASGLCMPEISAMGAIERLDIMLNDAMYGILFRDINMKRTLLDQYFSRMINAYAGIEIQTGEDNYLTTSDAIDKAYTVTASQLINEQFAILSGVEHDKMGLGHAFEINPNIEDSLSYELAHALLTKALFPNCPTKYMPPTKFATGNIFKTYLLNAMFNFISQITDQGVQLLGMMTEAIHTPYLADRALAIENAEYVFNAARNFGGEFELKKDGFINKRANQVLEEAINFLERVSHKGLFTAMQEGEFADIKRSENGGKGLGGVFKKSEDYYNPVMEKMKLELGI